jgi:AhpD family alkylhydroperoxidase
MAGNADDNFSTERERLQQQLLEHANRDVKRFLTLDTQAYKDGELPARTKEMLGLAASLVLRCDDCISYHLRQCHAAGVTTAELMELFNVCLIVGGSITIPHLRRAVDAWVGLMAEAGSG